LLKKNYDPALERDVEKEAPVVNLSDIKSGKIGKHDAVRVIYRTKVKNRKRGEHDLFYTYGQTEIGF